MSRSIHFYDYRTPEALEQRPPLGVGHPLRAAILTSVRDVGAEDRNGDTVKVAGRQEYMTGLLEGVANLLREGRHGLSKVLEIAGVINDDDPRDTLNGYGVSPKDGKWVHPADLRNGRGERIVSLTQNIPSSFRKLPLSDIDGRAFLKGEFERQVESVAQQMGADILISDHLMMRIDQLLDGRYGFGKILNIHPAMTRSGFQYGLRGKTPTSDAIRRAHGEKIDPATGQVEPPYFHTGSTLHLVNRVIDDGPVLADGELTAVHPDDEPQELRFRNYPTKIKVFAEGMRHYYRSVFPYVERGLPNSLIDFNHEPTSVPMESADRKAADPSAVRLEA
jgi:folate-dependent phosphoribosylglycinamide formyltransferase PurN